MEVSYQVQEVGLQTKACDDLKGMQEIQLREFALRSYFPSAE